MIAIALPTPLQWMLVNNTIPIAPSNKCFTRHPITRRRRFFQSNIDATYPIIKKDTESLCLVIFIHLVLHLLLCKIFLALSNAIYTSVAPSAATDVIPIVTPLDHVLTSRTFGRTIHCCTSCCSAIVVPSTT